MDEAGEFQGHKYTKRQRNIVYNHLASVQKGRAGEGCSIRLDSNSALADINHESSNGEPMKIIKRDIASIEIGVFKVDALTVEIPEESAQSVEALLGREKQIVGFLKEAVEKQDALQAKVDGLTGEVEEAKKTVQNAVSAEKMDALVNERAEIMTKAKEVGIDLAKEGTFEQQNKATKKAILLKSGKWKADKLDSSDAYMDAAWDQLIENWDHTTKVIKSRENLESNASRTDGQVDPLTKAQRGA
jgi:hypothetical protein